jgi:hypothetical protein
MLAYCSRLLGVDLYTEYTGQWFAAEYLGVCMLLRLLDRCETGCCCWSAAVVLLKYWIAA